MSSRKKQPVSGFAARLTQLRKARGLTQSQLADAAATTQRAISYYENGHGDPPLAAIVALARALRVSADEMLGLKPPKISQPQVSAAERRLWKKLRLVAKIPERDQRAVIRLINTLSGPARSASSE